MRVAALVATVAATAACAAMTIAERGAEPAYAVVLPDDPSPSEKYAAEELRDHVKALVGVELSMVTGRRGGPPVQIGKCVFVAIVNGQDARSPSGDDEFHLWADVDGNVHVEGGKRGVLYGVYELLETYGGIGWFASWRTYAPKAEKFCLPDELDVRQKPAILQRTPYWRDVKGDFAARVRANGGFQQVGAKHGGSAFRFGGGLGVCHTFDRLLPAKEHFAAHPEWYGYRAKKGKRCGDGRHAQLCLTNPEVLRLVTSNVLDRIRKDPGALCYGVSQNDSQEYCECETCKAVDEEEESHAGTMVRFVNAIAEAVEKEFPGKIIETLAYEYTRKPPKKTKLRHNVMPCLCTVECDMSRPLPESRYVQNVKFVDDIKTWHEQASRLYLWDYVTDFHALPYPFADVYALQGNVQFFRDNGVYALFEQGNRHGCHAGFAELKAWLLAKWMWNPDLPMKPLLDDFFAGFYGAGAPFVREYFEELHRLQIAYTSADTNRWLNCHQDIPSPDIPVEFWGRADALLEKAADAVKGDKALEFNVRTARFGVDFTRIEILRSRRGMVADLSVAGKGRESIERQRFLLKRALAFMDEARQVRLRSNTQINDEMLDEWRKIADGTMAARADGVVEDCFLKLNRLGKGNERVDDPQAEDGHAVKLTDTEPHWTIQFPMTEVTFESGRRYVLRMRLRADLVPGRDGQAVTIGIYDPKTKKYGCSGAYRTGQLSADYAWYDVGEFDPSDLTPRAYVYVGDGYRDKDGNRCVDALYLDCLQFAEAK